MRFYYISIISVILLVVIYAVGTAILVLFGIWLRKRWKRAWIVMVPLFLLLFVAPIGEELWIAWNFGQLCNKDAGIFITKTVKADGYYDATAGLLNVYTPVPKPAAEYYEKAGFRFYELGLANTQGGPSRVVHYEKVKGEWTPTVLDHPTARYHYKWPHMDTPMSHKVEKIERVVADSETGDILARETKYKRKAPWFFIGLDQPVMLCPGPGEHPLESHGSVFNLALKPTRN